MSWERQLLSWHVLKKSSHGGHREKILVNALGTPTFKLVCLKDKAGFTRRVRRAQRRDVFSRVNTRFMFPLRSLRSLCETLFYFSKICRTKVWRSQAHHRGVYKSKDGSWGRKNHLPRDNPHGHRGVRRTIGGAPTLSIFCCTSILYALYLFGNPAFTV